ncbi:MAG: YceI family protein [Gemmatimonadales bacterium]|nr:MAG: YceI family protein [Gemmatimonadales bacterium]
MFRSSTSILPAVLVAAGLSLAPPGASAQAAPGYDTSGTVRVDGGSTLRAWGCDARRLNVTIAATPEGTLALDELENAVSALSFEIPVAELRCDNDRMDGHMRSALGASDHPRILFRMTSYTVGSPAGGSAPLRIQGQLEMAGDARPVTVVAEASETNGGAVRLQGTHTLNMTEWGIRPPRLMLGTLRVREDVEIAFDLRVAPR